jgi:hypothetical protein
MALEPEKKIEESLHAYARKRREDAGAPLEMHPATRRMLQGEVAKLRAGQKAAESRPWWHSLLAVGPRFAAALGLFAVLAVGVWVFSDSERRRSSEMQDIAARTAPAPESGGLDDFTQTKSQTEALKEFDGAVAPTAPPAEPMKKLESKRATDRLSLVDAEKNVQSRDADTMLREPPTSPGQSKLLSETSVDKQVALRYELSAGQPAEALLAQGQTDKAKLDGSAVLMKQKSADSAVSYREAETRREKADAYSKERLGIEPAASTAITAGVSLATANKPAEARYFAFTDTTNAGVGGKVGDVAQQALNFGAAAGVDSLNAPTLAVATVQPALPPAVTTPLAATVNELADRQEAAKAELSRDRQFERFAGTAARPLDETGQEFQRQDASGPRVLQRFRVHQDNGRIRIQDADGSVYEGAVLLTDARADQKGVEAKDEVQARRTLAGVNASATSISFRASGTNRNLRQLVVINGELRQEPNEVGRGLQTAKVAEQLAPTASAPAAPAQSGVRLQDQPANAPAGTFRAPTGSSIVNTSSFVPTSIRGQVQVGATNQINLRAVRTR